VLDDAAAAGRQGEAALLALSIAADAGPGGPARSTAPGWSAPC
jgi:hypothetical protein